MKIGVSWHFGCGMISIWYEKSGDDWVQGRTERTDPHADASAAISLLVHFRAAVTRVTSVKTVVEALRIARKRESTENLYLYLYL